MPAAATELNRRRRVTPPHPLPSHPTSTPIHLTASLCCYTYVLDCITHCFGLLAYSNFSPWQPPAKHPLPHPPPHHPLTTSHLNPLARVHHPNLRTHLHILPLYLTHSLFSLLPSTERALSHQVTPTLHQDPLIIQEAVLVLGHHIHRDFHPENHPLSDTFLTDAVIIPPPSLEKDPLPLNPLNLTNCVQEFATPSLDTRQNLIVSTNTLLAFTD